MINKKFHDGIFKFNSLKHIYGFWGALHQVMRNLILVELCYRFEKDLHTPEDHLIPKIPLDIIPLQGEIDFYKWGIHDSILNIRGPYGVEQAKERLASGFVMFCAISNNKIAGFIWLNSFPVTGAGYTLIEDEAYHIDGWTFEPYRGKGVLPVLQQGVFNYLRTNYPHIRVLIGHASARNKPSIIGQQRAGLVLTARELSIVFFGLHRKIRLNSIN